MSLGLIFLYTNKHTPIPQSWNRGMFVERMISAIFDYSKFSKVKKLTVYLKYWTNAVLSVHLM